MNHYNELSRKIFNEYANNEKAKNVCISTDCVTLGFEALYLGTGGVTRHWTKFNATWKRPFDSEKTDKNGIFFVMPNISEQVDMMIDDKIHSILVSKMETDLNVTAIKLPYKDEFGDSYIAIMPNRVATKDELLSLFSSLDLDKFLSSFVEIRCCYLGVPKYTTETDVSIDDGSLSSIEALTAFRKPDLSNMFNGGLQYDYLKYKTIVTVNEMGTQVDVYVDGVSRDRKIELNRPFLYLIVDRKNYISTIGTFMEPK